jgi:uncharacterized protein YegL
MSLGSPVYLGLLGLIPLVLYLHMSRRATRRVPSTVLWKLVAADVRPHPRRQPVKVTTSLLMQLAFVLVLAFTLAEPRPAGSSGTHHVLVIDAGLEAGGSAADGATSAYESAWRRWLQSLPKDNGLHAYSVWWVGPWTRPVALELESLSGLERALAATTHSDSPPDWLAAREALAGQDLDGAELTVVANNPYAAEAALGTMPLSNVRFEPLRAQVADVEILTATVTLEDATAQRWSVAARALIDPLKISGIRTVTFRVSFLPAGSTAWLPYEEREVTINQGGQAVFSASLTLPGPGVIEIRVKEAQSLTAAATRLFNVDPSPPTPQALVLTSLGEASPVARVLSATGRFDVRVATDPIAGEDVNLLVIEGDLLPNLAGLELESSSVLWLGGGPDALAAEAEWSVGAEVVRWDVDHPVTRHTDWKNLDGVNALRLNSVGEVLVEGVGGPLVVVRSTRLAKEVIAGFDPTDTRFSESEAFVSFMLDTADWLVPPVRDVTSCQVGRPCPVPWRLVASGFEARLEGGPVWRQPPPAGANVPSRLDEAWVPLRAGLWWLTSTSGERITVAVNPVQGGQALARSADAEGPEPQPLTAPRFWLPTVLLASCILLVLAEGLLEGRRPRSFWRRSELLAPGSAGQRARRLAVSNVLTTGALSAALLAIPLLSPRPTSWTVLVTEGSEPVSRQFDVDMDRVSVVRAGDTDGAIDLRRAMEVATARLDPALDLHIVVAAGLMNTRGDGVMGLGPVIDRGATVHVFDARSEMASADVVAAAIHHNEVIYLGDVLEVTAVVHATSATNALITLRMDGEVLGHWTTEIPQGWSTFSAEARPDSDGPKVLRLEVSAQRDEEPVNDVTESLLTVLKGPRVMVLSSDELRGERFARMLASRGFEVSVRGPHTVPARAEALTGTDAIVLMDVAAIELARSQQEALTRWVRDLGGGLAIIGGEHAFGSGGYIETNLDTISPLSSRVSRDAPAVSMLFVLDRSGSMQQNVGAVSRLEVAKEATLAATELLGPGSEVAVIVFDEVAQVLVPFTDVSSLDAIHQGLSRLVPGGGTSLFPALELAGEILSTTESASRHVVVMTDGLSQPGDFEGAVERLVAQNATVSAIAIGAGADVERVRNIARIGRGTAHVTSDFLALPSILAQEAMLLAGDPVVTERSVPVRTDADPTFMSGTPYTFPPLRGLVETTPKVDATVLIEDEMGRPVLAAWRFGAGRVLAFTSQGVGPWASDWIDNPESPDWWAAWVRWSARVSRSKGIDLATRVVGDEIQLEVLATDDQGAPRVGLELMAAVRVDFAGPAAAQNPGEVRLKEVEPGVYAARLRALPGIQTVVVRNLRTMALVSEAVVVNKPYPSARGVPATADLFVEGLVMLTGGVHITPESSWTPARGTTWDFAPARKPWLVLAAGIWTVHLLLRYTPGWLTLSRSRKFNPPGPGQRTLLVHAHPR